MLDCSPKKIKEYSEKYGYDFWQLRTPLTKNKIADCTYALDNGCYTQFDYGTWLRMVGEAQTIKPLFITLPDIVGDARRTLELFNHFMSDTGCAPRALVLQDGISNVDIPWRWISAVFVGGSDSFKISQEAIAACKAAKMLDKWVHVGRVNTPARIKNYIGLADSIDGSGISRFDHMLESVLNAINEDEKQYSLLDANGKHD